MTVAQIIFCTYSQRYIICIYVQYVCVCVCFRFLYFLLNSASTSADSGCETIRTTSLSPNKSSARGTCCRRPFQSMPFSFEGCFLGTQHTKHRITSNVTSSSHRIYVWYIYLDLASFGYLTMVNVGKYTIHKSFGGL